MLVTDDVSSSELIARVLRMDGHTVDVEADVAAGLHQVVEWAGHDLIILDLELSDVDGVGMCDEYARAVWACPS